MMLEEEHIPISCQLINTKIKHTYTHKHRITQIQNSFQYKLIHYFKFNTKYTQKSRSSHKKKYANKTIHQIVK